MSKRAIFQESLLEAALEAVEAVTHVPRLHITSRLRCPLVAEARMMVYALLREYGLSLQVTGSLLKRDHTAVLHGVNRLHALAAHVEQVREELARARALMQKRSGPAIAAMRRSEVVGRTEVMIRQVSSDAIALRMLGKIICGHLKKLEEPQA